MKADKEKKLQAIGWSVGSTSDFLELNEEEEAFVETKLSVAEKPSVSLLPEEDLDHMLGE